MNCKSGSCATTISVELANCHGNAANCCFGPSCAVCDTEMDFIPDGGAFEATFTQNGANKTGAQQATINDACTSHDGTYACTTVRCTSTPRALRAALIRAVIESAQKENRKLSPSGQCGALVRGCRAITPKLREHPKRWGALQTSHFHGCVGGHLPPAIH